MSDVDKYRKLHNLRPNKERTGFVAPKRDPIKWGTMAQGSAAGLLGMPVDMINLLTRVKKPVMGSQWIGDKLKADTSALEFDVGQFLEPGGMAKAGISGLGALGGIIKGKGGNWLSGSVEDSLKGLKGATAPRYNHMNEHGMAVGEAYGRPMTADELATYDDAELFNKNRSLNSWVNTTLNKYVKNRMATPDDEIRKLADQGILHVDPEQLNFRLDTYGKFPVPNEEFLAKSDLAKVWEGVSDNSLSTDNVGDLLSDSSLAGSTRKIDNPWLSKVSKDTPVHSVYPNKYFNNDLGFDHLIDELRNSMDPASGFPMDLRLTPEAMGGLSMEEALKKVHGINQFRAEKAKKVNARFAQAEGIPVHKEYNDNWKWLEYKKPDELPKGIEVRNDGQSGFHVYKNGKDVSKSSGHYTEQDALDEFKNKYGKDKLESWLKQEGDTMGHCVGGYCDDVESGEARILSLRDNEGKSVATVELRYPDPYKIGEIDYISKHDPKFAARLRNDDEFMEDGADTIGLLEERYAEDYQRLLDEAKPYITQVKGPGNKKPDAKAIPYIQDFVKSSGYRVDGDLHNTDLIPAHSLTNEERLANPGEYFTIDEIKEIRKDRPWTPLDTDSEW